MKNAGRHILLAAFSVTFCPAQGQSTWPVDSLLATWPVQQRLAELRIKPQVGSWPRVDNEDLYSALKQHAPALPVFADSLVELYTNVYLGPRRDQFRILLGMAELHFPLIERELARHGLPNEVKYLPMALSAMNSQANSVTGGSGLWMLTYPVAMRYGLVVTKDLDERRDAQASTIAAMRYLQDLQGFYGDWPTAIVAFACGPANLNRARIRSTDPRDPRLLHPQFSPSHRDLLPLLMAFVHLSTNAEALGLDAITFKQREQPDTVQHDSVLIMRTVAQVMGIPLPRLQALNPTIVGGRFPARTAFLLPRGDGSRFANLGRVITEAQQVKPRSPVADEKPGDVVDRLPDGREAILYRITLGDCLQCIADRFNLKAHEVRTWNDLASDQVEVGNTLVLYVPMAERLRFESDTTQFTGQTPLLRADTLANKGSRPPPAGDGDFSWYTVRSGDSLYVIAKRYTGITADDLMRFNKISANIKPGQRIKIPKR